MAEIKICGLYRACDIDYINEADPDYAGFILNFPRSHRNLSPEQAKPLRFRLKPQIRAVGVFVDQPQEVILEAARVLEPDVIQLHGNESGEYIRALREKVRIPVWKAFRIRRPEDLDAAKESPADLVLLDNGYGTGEAFDWTVATDFDRPFILAGGLTPENIPEAVRLLQPQIVDISSGVETERMKDPVKIRAAVAAARM